jgi:hypothetical protein
MELYENGMPKVLKLQVFWKAHWDFTLCKVLSRYTREIRGGLFCFESVACFCYCGTVSCLAQFQNHPLSCCWDRHTNSTHNYYWGQNSQGHYYLLHSTHQLSYHPVQGE